MKIIMINDDIDYDWLTDYHEVGWRLIENEDGLIDYYDEWS